MFTGIIQEIARIGQIQKPSAKLIRYSIILSEPLLKGLQHGASVSIDGICQTVVSIEPPDVWFEAIEETILRTTLRSLNPGQLVNIERAAKIGDEIGGHLLSGHIYGTAQLYEIKENQYWFNCSADWIKYFLPKGFIAIDGISLTLVEVLQEGRFCVHLIPETLKSTVLGKKQPGDFVNIEIDALTQATVDTVERILKKRSLG